MFDKFLKKLKRIEIKKSYIVAIVVLAVVIRFWGENTITMLQKDVPVITSTEISQSEFERYMQIKSMYISENINVSYELVLRSDFEEKLDKDIHEWFLVQRWRPSRFFYVDRRINEILNLIKEQELRKGEADRLDAQALEVLRFKNENPNASKTAAELKKQANDIRYYLNRNIRYAGITDEEEALVRENRYILENFANK